MAAFVIGGSAAAASVAGGVTVAGATTTVVYAGASTARLGAGCPEQRKGVQIQHDYGHNRPDDNGRGPCAGISARMTEDVSWAPTEIRYLVYTVVLAFGLWGAWGWTKTTCPEEELKTMRGWPYIKELWDTWKPSDKDA